MPKIEEVVGVRADVLKEKKDPENTKREAETEAGKADGENRAANSCGLIKNGVCTTCGRKIKKSRKRFYVVSFALIIFAYFSKIYYEKLFKQTVVEDVLTDFLNLKAVIHLKLSEETKANIMHIAAMLASSPDSEFEDMPGILAAKKGVKGKHPITIIPGIANSSLELWKTNRKTNSFFRKKIWGSHSTITFMLHNKAEWFASMKLDEDTGLDPHERKVRASLGLDSSDFEIPGMWFWWKIIENLAHLEYEPGKVHFASFDWRLGMEELEKRDGYFTKLKIDIEHQKAASKQKSVIVAHSLGSLITHYFMQWVTEKDKKWVDNHIHAVVYIGGPLLGVPKVIACLLTGEMKATTQMGFLQYAIAELLFGRERRKEIFKTWTSPLYLLPKGGGVFWEGAPPPDKVAYPHLIHSTGENGEEKSYNIEEILEEVEKVVSPYNKKALRNILDPTKKEAKWSNPLLSPLPYAPNMTIYLMYGVDKTTERAYHFSKKGKDFEINKNHTDKNKGVFRGIYTSDGDGTVPLVSCGYMGYAGWKSKALNPSRMKIVNREYRHKEAKSFLEIRGGPETAEHINILGNSELISDILTVASGGAIEERITSNLPEIVEEIERKRKIIEKG